MTARHDYAAAAEEQLTEAAGWRDSSERTEAALAASLAQAAATMAVHHAIVELTAAVLLAGNVPNGSAGALDNITRALLADRKERAST